MHKTKFLGIRMEKEVYDIIDKVTQEESLDKTSAIKMLIQKGWKEFISKKPVSIV